MILCPKPIMSSNVLYVQVCHVEQLELAHLPSLPVPLLTPCRLKCTEQDFVLAHPLNPHHPPKPEIRSPRKRKLRSWRKKGQSTTVLEGLPLSKMKQLKSTPLLKHHALPHHQRRPQRPPIRREGRSSHHPAS